MSLQLQYKKLKYEIKYLELEHTETETTFRNCIDKFEPAFRKAMGSDYKDPNEGKGVILNEKIKYEELPIEKEKIVKKVYRKIVTKTHPDKLEKIPNSKLKDKLVQQFKDAAEHYDNNDIVSLFDAADELGIDLPEIDESHINMMETNVQTLKTKVQRLRDSNAWKWFHSEEREFIMNQIINSL
jgi:hypothetical protein